MNKGTALAILILLSGGFPGGSVPANGRAFGSEPQESAQQAAATPTARQIGTVKAIQNNAITLTTDSGSAVKVVVQESTRMLRTEPGQRDLSAATPIRFEDIRVGDRILVRGKTSDDAQTVTASSLISITRTDIEQKQARDREDWQKRGVGGLVSGVDTSAGTITISTSDFGVAKPVTVHITKDTILRRYAPNSVKFDDAKPATLDEIKSGDQLRARGTRSADGSAFVAAEVVTGSFRNIAGTVSSIDASARTLSLVDLITKHPVLVRFTSDSQLGKLPPMMAERIALRLKGAPAGEPPNRPPSEQGASGTPAFGPPREGRRTGGSQRAGQRAGGPPDLQQILSRMPPVALADFAKGEPVMIVSTQGSVPEEVTAITLLGGVESILRASPEGGPSMILSPWNLDGPGPEAAGP